MDEQEKDRLLRRGVAETIVESELIELLDSGKSLRLKMGFDPSAPDIHLGHAVGLRKLRQFQELGHKLVLIVGDWTARIGDPSGRSKTRPMLSADEVSQNAETYMAQFFKLVDRDRSEVRFQSEWFGSFTLTNVFELTNRFTVAQMLAREDFAKRYSANQPIAITELLYPLLQAYDSVPVESDVEFGGMDQKFNLLVGRDLQQMMGMRPQQCLLVPLLPGTDGVEKMSKSLGNYIGVDEPPNEMFGKTMSLPDSMIVPYFENLTDVSDGELEEIRGALDGASVNPMDLKKRLAGELVEQFHDGPAARAAQKYFERTVQGGVSPDDIKSYELPPPSELAGKRLSHVLVDAALASSVRDARRLIDQGAVQLDGEKVAADSSASELEAGTILRAGRRRMVRLVGPGG
jgi:tyrosyl-tRNA synthetase